MKHLIILCAVLLLAPACGPQSFRVEVDGVEAIGEALPGQTPDMQKYEAAIKAKLQAIQKR